LGWEQIGNPHDLLFSNRLPIVPNNIPTGVVFLVPHSISDYEYRIRHRDHDIKNMGYEPDTSRRALAGKMVIRDLQRRRYRSFCRKRLFGGGCFGCSLVWQEEMVFDERSTA
jgi:hypothetical protein